MRLEIIKCLAAGLLGVMLGLVVWIAIRAGWYVETTKYRPDDTAEWFVEETVLYLKALKGMLFYGGVLYFLGRFLRGH